MLVNVANVQLVPVTLLTADVLVDANRDIQRPVIAKRVQFEFYILAFSFDLKTLSIESKMTVYFNFYLLCDTVSKKGK